MIYLKEKKDFEALLFQNAVEEVGEKAISLLKIPKEWTPPFFVFNTYFFFICEENKGERIVNIEPLKDTVVELSKKLEELKSIGFFKVIVRSSATIETLNDRGSFESIECNNDLNEVLVTIERIFVETRDLLKENSKNKLALIIQGYISPHYSGHLSNERRIAKGLNAWSIEFINHSSNESHWETFKVSQNQLPLELTSIQCRRKDEVIQKLKRLAFNTYSQEERCHFEWIWDGNILWIVQKDCEITEPGAKPGSNWTYPDVKIIHSQLKVLKVDKDCKDHWSKINNIETFRFCELASVTFFVLENLNIKERLLKDEDCGSLDEDLQVLAVYPIVIRTSLRKGDTTHPGLYLPRTDTLFEWQSAKKFILETTKKLVIEEGLNPSDFSFLIHHFIVSKSCALVYTVPNRNKVRIDSSWGLADGLAYNSYDSFEVDLFEKKIKKKIRGKHEYLDVDDKGNWIIKKSGSNWDWKQSLEDKEVISIAEMCFKVSSFLKKPLILMFFINYSNSKIHAPILPWQLIHEIPEFSDTISERMFNRNKITVSNKHDFVNLKKRYKSSNENNKITIHLKLDPKNLRDTHFIKEIGSLAKEADFHLEIEGSTLSHVYYILSNQGVKVRCFDLFEPKYGKQKFNKLVRDKIPAKISFHGESSVITKIPQNLLIELLKAKAVEEALELQNAPDQKNLLEELADILEIVKSISNVIKTPFTEIEKLADKKREERGGFEEGVYLRETEEISITNFRSKKRKQNERISMKSFRGQKAKLEESKIILSLVPSILRKEVVVLHLKNINKYAYIKYAEKEVIISIEDTIINPNPNQLNLF